MVKAIDLQVQIGVEGRIPFKDKERFDILMKYFKASSKVIMSEEEWIAGMKNADVCGVVWAGGFRSIGWKDLDEVKRQNDYVGELIKKYPDVIVGAWVALDPDWGRAGVKELERCIYDLKTFGVAVCGAFTGIPADDYRWYPYYEVCEDADVPIKIWVGHLAYGSGQPGGWGIKLWTERPIPHVDNVAADFPKLKIICAHYAWPFEKEMASVLIHKGNVYNELHGWLPRYFDESFKREINTRLQDKIMFGSDYPWFSYERLFQDWESQGFKPEVLEKVFVKNAQKVLKLEL